MHTIIHLRHSRSVAKHIGSFPYRDSEPPGSEWCIRFHTFARMHLRRIASACEPL